MGAAVVPCSHDRGTVGRQSRLRRRPCSTTTCSPNSEYLPGAKDLVAMAFSTGPPTAGNPRLRLNDYSASCQNWTSQHEGHSFYGCCPRSISSWRRLVVMSEDSMASAASPIKLNRPSGIRPIRPHCGQGPDRFPLRVMLVEFSNELPERKMVPQVWQIAGRVDMAARLARPSAACWHNVICRNSTVTRTWLGTKRPRSPCTLRAQWYGLRRSVAGTHGQGK